MKILFLCFILFASSTFANEKKLDKVKLQLQWKHQFEFAGFYAAKEKGFYESAGLDVQFIEYSNDIDIIEDVLNDKAQYGTTYSNLISSYLEGKSVVFMANFFKQSALALVTQKDIKLPNDLVGKKIMGAEGELMIMMMFKKFGINSSQYKVIKPSFNINDFIDKKVDAMTVFTTNETYLLDKKGIKYNLFNPTVYGAEFYDINLFTSQNELNKNPNRVKTFKEASIKGWKYALENQDEIIKLILKKYNTQNKSKDALIYEAKQIENLILPKLYPIGSIEKNRVKMMAENFIESGLIENNKRLDFNNFIYDPLKKNITLNKNEYKYLNKKQNITMCIDLNWFPFEAIDKNGKHIGMSREYINIFSKTINTPIELVMTKTWSESLEFIKEKKCDILPFAMKTPKREKYMKFTTPYFHSNLVVIGLETEPFVANFKELLNKRIGITKGYAYFELLKNEYKNINLIEVDSLEKGLNLIKNGQLDGFIDALEAVGGKIQNEYLGEIKVIAKLDEYLELSIATNKDEPHLNAIFQKAINKLTIEDHALIKNRYLPVTIEKKVDYSFIYKILFLFFIAILFVLYRQYLLHKLNRDLEIKVKQELEKSKDKDNMINQQSKLVSTGEMITNISHQWRQPLASLNGVLVNLDYDYENSKLDRKSFNDYLNEAENLTTYMSKTIEDFSDFFNPKKEKEIFSIKELLVTTRNLLSVSLKNEKILLEIKGNKDIEINSFKSELMQIILTIISNAKDAFILNDIKNRVIIISLSQSEKEIIIDIQDNAGGIEEKIIGKIFDPYFTTKEKSQGTGLGLYIANNIIEKSLNGELSAKNEKKGARFTIRVKKLSFS